MILKKIHALALYDIYGCIVNQLDRIKLRFFQRQTFKQFYCQGYQKNE